MKVLVVGLGSIAQKHLSALRQLQPDAEIVALRSSLNADKAEAITNIYNWQEVPGDLDFVMICNPTSEHLETIKKAAELGVPLFIEKPPLMSLEGADELLGLIRERGIRTYTAFNLRFHPVLQWLKENLRGKRVLEVQAYCGSYLPDWRPGRDYRKVYSANKEMGGGVHLELIHECDYLFFLFGYPQKVNLFISKVSDLEINSNDVAHYWLEHKGFNTSILLNYYRRDPKRTMEIVFEDETWTADLLKSKVYNSQGEELFSDQRPITDTYISQLEYFLKGLNEDNPYSNNLFESVETLKYSLAK